MLKIIYSSLIFCHDKTDLNNNLNHAYENIIYPVENLYILNLENNKIILKINIEKIKEIVNKGEAIPQRKAFFKVLKYYKKIHDEQIVNKIFSKQKCIKNNFFIYGNDTLNLDGLIFNLKNQSIISKYSLSRCKIKGGIYLEKYQYGRYNRNYDFENKILSISKNPNLICVSNSRQIWKSILAKKKYLYISTLSQYKKLTYFEIQKYDYIILNISLLNNSYYKNKFNDYYFDNSLTKQSVENMRNDFKNNENLLWEYEPIFNIMSWNNLILDFNLDDLKKNFNKNLLNFNFESKWVIFNEYLENRDNYNTLFSLFNSKLSPVDIESFVIKNKEFIPKINYNIEINNLTFNSKEKEGYDLYRNDFKEIYMKKNMKFEEDEYLQKYCSYPQKQIKINKIVKNLKNNKNLNNLTDKYREFIQQKLDNNELECKICLDKISEDNIGLTSCGHFFCYSCIYKSKSYSSHCPSCRENLSLDKIFYVSDNSNNLFIGSDILDELGTKNSNLMMEISNYKKILIVSNFDVCLKKISLLLNELDIENIITRGKKNLENTDVYLSNYEEEFLDIKYQGVEKIFFVEPYYHKNFRIKLYDIYRATNQNNFKFFIIKDTIEDSVLNNNRFLDCSFVDNTAY